MKKRIYVLAATVLCGCASVQRQNGSTPPLRTNVVSYDHFGCQRGGAANDPDCTLHRRLVLRDGEMFTVEIERTNPDAFEYVIEGVERVDSSVKAQGVPREQLRTVTLRRIHDKRYGGYVVTIRRKSNSAATELAPTTLEIEVRTEEWKASFGGGFSASNLTDPAFAVRDTTITVNNQPQTQRKLVEQGSRKDDARRGIATFVHVWNTRWPGVALSFGLGLNREQGNEYYLGLSGRLGDRATFTVGPVLGSVAAPPSGVELGDIVADENVLNDLGTRTKAGIFAGISYSFLGGGSSDLSKPFLGAETPTVSPPAPQSVTPAAPAPTDALSVSATGGNQAAAPGQALPNALQVSVTRADGTPAKQIAVKWSIGSGGGTILTSQNATSDDGKASATVRLGQAPPVEQKVIVEFPSLGKTCEFTVFAGTAPANLTPVTCN